MRWLLSQRWNDLLFAHWPVQPSSLARLLPDGVEPDVCDGRAWIRVGGEPGVWFLSLDTSSPLFVAIGRSLYGLRYRLARMVVVRDGARVHYASARGPAAFAATYEASGRGAPARASSLEHWLLERYR